jgi:hypothetical protein
VVPDEGVGDEGVLDDSGGVAIEVSSLQAVRSRDAAARSGRMPRVECLVMMASAVGSG